MEDTPVSSQNLAGALTLISFDVRRTCVAHACPQAQQALQHGGRCSGHGARNAQKGRLQPDGACRGRGGAAKTNHGQGPTHHPQASAQRRDVAGGGAWPCPLAVAHQVRQPRGGQLGGVQLPGQQHIAGLNVAVHHLL